MPQAYMALQGSFAIRATVQREGVIGLEGDR